MCSFDNLCKVNTLHSAVFQNSYLSPITNSAYRTSLLLPSLLRRVDDLLLVKELNAKFFDHSIAENHLHAAVSSPSATVEVDYERLELLGG